MAPKRVTRATTRAQAVLSSPSSSPRELPTSSPIRGDIDARAPSAAAEQDSSPLSSPPAIIFTPTPIRGLRANQERLAAAKKTKVSKPAPKRKVPLKKDLLEMNVNLIAQIAGMEAAQLARQERDAERNQELKNAQARLAQALQRRSPTPPAPRSPTSPVRSPGTVQRLQEQNQALQTALEEANRSKDALAAALEEAKQSNDSMREKLEKASLLKVNGKRNLGQGWVPVIPQNVVDDDDFNLWPDVRAPWSKGLRNSGNYCYRNAALQALLHVPAFYRYLGTMHEDCSLHNNECVVCALQSLAHSYWDRQSLEGSTTNNVALAGPTLALDAFNSACDANPPKRNPDLASDFATGRQSDASEFITYLLDQVREKELADDDPTFRNTFVIEGEHPWTCQHCQNVTTRPSIKGGEPGRATTLLVAIGDDHGPGDGLPLTTYLNRIHNERIEWNCTTPQCEGMPEMIFRDVATRITRAPEVFIVVIHRWWVDMDIGNRTGVFTQNKIFHDIEFDEYLDMDTLTKNGRKLRYQLDGVVAHRGPNIDGGHYISAVRKYEGEEFHTINDDALLRQHRRGGFNEMRHPASEYTQNQFVDLDDDEENCFQPSILIYSKIA